MPYMKSLRITSTADGVCQTGETGGESSIFIDSQFFLAKDGTWLMVDWVPDSAFSDRGKWYVTEGAM